MVLLSLWRRLAREIRRVAPSRSRVEALARAKVTGSFPEPSVILTDSSLEGFRGNAMADSPGPFNILIHRYVTNPVSQREASALGRAMPCIPIPSMRGRNRPPIQSSRICISIPRNNRFEFFAALCFSR